MASLHTKIRSPQKGFSYVVRSTPIDMYARSCRSRNFGLRGFEWATLRRLKYPNMWNRYFIYFKGYNYRNRWFSFSKWRILQLKRLMVQTGYSYMLDQVRYVSGCFGWEACSFLQPNIEDGLEAWFEVRRSSYCPVSYPCSKLFLFSQLTVCGTYPASLVHSIRINPVLPSN